MKNKYLILGCLTLILIVASGCEKKAQSKDMTPPTTTTSESSLVATSETVAATITQTSTETTTETSSEKPIPSSSQNSTETTTSSEIKLETPTETSPADTLPTTSADPSSSEATVSSTTTETTTSESTEIENGLDLGIIYYEHLNLNDPIQANAKYLGCYLVDDGETINFVPLMSDTVQNLHEYTSGHGNEDYYQQVINYALETSNLTRGKPVSVLDREGGVVIITAKEGKITYSLS